MPKDIHNNDTLQELGTLFDRIYCGGGVLLHEPLQLSRALKYRRDRTPLQDVAIKAGVSSATVNRVETDGGTIVMAQKVAEAMGYDLKFVLVRRERQE